MTNTSNTVSKSKRFYSHLADAKSWRASADRAPTDADREFRRAMAEIFAECAEHAGTVNL